MPVRFLARHYCHTFKKNLEGWSPVNVRVLDNSSKFFIGMYRKSISPSSHEPTRAGYRTLIGQQSQILRYVQYFARDLIIRCYIMQQLLFCLVRARNSQDGFPTSLEAEGQHHESSCTAFAMLLPANFARKHCAERGEDTVTTIVIRD